MKFEYKYNDFAPRKLIWKCRWIWKHFLRYWPFARGIHRSPVNSPHKGQWRGALMFTLICTRINGWVNNCEAGDLRCNRAHHDVIVMNLHDVIRRMAMITQSCAIWSIWAGASLAIEYVPLMFVGNQRLGCGYPWNKNVMSQSNYALMTSSNGNICRVIGPLWGESPVTGGFPSSHCCLWAISALAVGVPKIRTSCPKVIMPWWRHQMETFAALLALCEGNHQWPVDSPRSIDVCGQSAHWLLVSLKWEHHAPK